MIASSKRHPLVGLHLTYGNPAEEEPLTLGSINDVPAHDLPLICDHIQTITHKVHAARDRRPLKADTPDGT